ncbi:transposase, partial [bacterium]|nr:transposase [bacterium]
FKSINDWKKNKSKYNGMPSIPKYKKKESVRNVLIYTIQAISKSYFNKHNKIKLSKSNIIKTNVKYQDLKQVRIIPRYDHYVIEVVYQKENICNDNNLCAVTTTKKDFFLINGRPLKSINYYYNKTLASAKSKLEKELKEDYLKQKKVFL